MYKLSLILIASLSSSIALAAADEVHVMAYAHQYSGIKGMQVYTKAEHDIEIINNSDHPKSYNYGYNYCADFSSCVSKGNNITVPAHGRWNNHYESYLNPTYNYEGNYNLIATTTVYGDTQYKYDGFGVIIVR